ncbi:amidase [Roseomonas sp. GC11]|uniref:amidase n=1 Tax=Roseomonas sp. GC11 TaxID=2950546 RepID=UPI00210D0A74|nr:amidase [Roseomonas sp. GC11]MCQ4159365.1 amidase [Roseomonas sp. GC11]
MSITALRPASGDLATLSLTEAAAALAAGDTTAEALTAACLERIRRHDGRLNSVIWLEEEAALQAARAADQRRARGEATGPLHGIPMAHKDMYYQAGRPCTCGSAIRRDFRPAYTATVITRLEDAGAITMGGLNMAEFAQNPTGHNRHFGDCQNPWRHGAITGGSSSGSGVAVAASFAFMALGSDTGGSIRLPAAACGVTGLKPTQTRISRHGVMPLSFSCDNVGPLARSVRDCAAVMQVIAGHDPRDPTSAREPVPDYTAALTGDLRGLRIGVAQEWFLDEVDDKVHAAFMAALTVLRERGATVQAVTLPMMDQVLAYSAVVSRAEAATIHATWMRDQPGDYAAHLSGRLYPGYALPATHYIEALSRRGPVLRGFAQGVFGQVDLLASPTIAQALPSLDETRIDSGDPEAIRRFGAVSRNTRPFNYLGLPAISVPCGFDGHGAPVGLQLAGRPFGEATLMRATEALQRDTEWHRMRPELEG